MALQRNPPFQEISCAKSVKGLKSGASSRCHGCQGAGMRVTTRQSAPGMIQQMQHVCPECRGSGESVNEKDRCQQCTVKKVTQEKKVLEVHVEKGLQNGQKITFGGQADDAPDTVTGDIVFLLQLKEHPKSKRKQDDLYVEHNINLTEALCFFQFALTHLDDRQLLTKTNPGEVIKPDQYKGINDEGMPQWQRPYMKGKLVIHFNVAFPETGALTPEKCKLLETILPSGGANSSSSEMALDDCEETILHDVYMEEEMRRKEYQRQQKAYDEDEDDEPGVQRVGCTKQ